MPDIQFRPIGHGLTSHEVTLQKVCRRCGSQFETTSRVKKRCNSCQQLVEASKQPVYAERVKKRKVSQ